jgi:hypothetical protein
MASATGITSVASYMLVSFLPLQAGDRSSFYITFPKFAFIAGMSFMVYLAISRLFRLQEAVPVIAAMKKYGRKMIRVVH